MKTPESNCGCAQPRNSSPCFLSFSVTPVNPSVQTRSLRLPGCTSQKDGPIRPEVPAVPAWSARISKCPRSNPSLPCSVSSSMRRGGVPYLVSSPKAHGRHGQGSIHSNLQRQSAREVCPPPRPGEQDRTPRSSEKSLSTPVPAYPFVLLTRGNNPSIRAIPFTCRPAAASQ
jgi:hypothetical protein